MQPPLWNGLGLVLYRGYGAEFEVALHWLQTALGAALPALLFVVLRAVLRRPRVALAIAALFAADPALILYEAYALYPLLVAFLTLAVCALVALHERSGRWAPLAAAVAVANVLVLTRSLYHPIVLLLLAALVLLRTPAPRRAAAALVLVVLSLPTAAWLVKNQVRFGFFGTSSWLGQNVWRVVSSNYSAAELAELARRGVVAPAAARWGAFAKPSAFRSSGFDRVAGVPELDGDDYNNINEIEISRLFARSSLRLLVHDPRRAARGAARAALVYTAPSSRFKHLEPNRRRLGWHETVFSGWLLGDDWLRIPGDRGHSGPVFLALAALSAAAALRRWRRRRLGGGLRGVIAWIHQRPTLVVVGLLALYNLGVGTLLDLGENERFKFEVESLFWCLFAYGLIGRHEPTSGDGAKLS